MIQAPRHQPRPYQVDGIAFLADRDKALLAFDTRLGKSMVALQAAEKIGAGRILVVGPAISRLSWADEVRKSLGVDAYVVRPGDKPSENVVVDSPFVLVVSYDTLSNDTHGWTKALSSWAPWDVVILDECQYLKTPGANRTEAVYGRIVKNAKRVWLLSATPTPNHAGEFYPHYRALWPDAPPMSKQAFEDHFCKVQNTPWGRRISGSRRDRADEFKAKFAAHVLRKRKADVVADMPAVQHNTIERDMALGAVETNAALGMNELDQLLDSGTNTGPGASLTRALGEAKADAAARWVADQLENGTMTNVVVFAWHRSVLDKLETGLASFDPVRVDGRTSETARRTAVESFQTGRSRVFIGQIKAAGTAICLDAADDVVIVEPSWVPMDNYQASCRVENVGNKKAVSVSWLTCADPLDKKIMSVLSAKTSELAAIWD